MNSENFALTFVWKLGLDGDHNPESSLTGRVGQKTVPAFGSGGVAPWGRLRGRLERGRFSGLARSVRDRSFRAGWAGKRLLEPASAGFSGRGFSQAPGPRGLKPPLEKDRKRPSGEGGEAADPGVKSGSNTLRARPLKRPPRKGHCADRFSSDRWKSKLQICLASC